MTQLAYRTIPTDTASPKSQSIVVLGIMSEWLVPSFAGIDDGPALSYEDEQRIATGFNAILSQFDDPTMHKSYNSVEELFADLDKKTKESQEG